MGSNPRTWGLIAIFLVLSACSREKRVIDPNQPISAPVGNNDPRSSQYSGNHFQISTGGRYFAWYGCNVCHSAGAPAAENLAARLARKPVDIASVYRAIQAHGELGSRIPSEQLWQLSAYVEQLASLDPAKRRRQDLDQSGEAQAGNWQGPVL